MTITPEEIRHLLQGYSHILLTAHVNPDGDAIGSLAAIQDYLDRLGKQVVTVVDDDNDDKLFYLPSVCRY